MSQRLCMLMVILASAQMLAPVAPARAQFSSEPLNDAYWRVRTAENDVNRGKDEMKRTKCDLNRNASLPDCVRILAGIKQAQLEAKEARRDFNALQRGGPGFAARQPNEIDDAAAANAAAGAINAAGAAANLLFGGGGFGGGRQGVQHPPGFQHPR